MTSNRIQKLLFSEYSDFEDIILVESPFAETNRQGRGLRQVQIGLTPSKLILATYTVQPTEEFLPQEKPRRDLDPDIENFELVSAYPVECVNLSVFRHRRRQTLKARFCNGNVGYYEIGGWQERKMLWSVWCERIRFLSPYETATCVSETSVATSSSSASSLHIVRSSLSVSQSGKPTLWCHYATAQTKLSGSWGDPHLYLGPAFLEKGVNLMCLPGDGKPPASRSEDPSRKPRPKRNPAKERLLLSAGHELLAQEAVDLWQSQSPLMRRVHRRYGLHPSPHLLDGLGLWPLSRAQAFSLQTKRSVSAVDLSRPWDQSTSQITVSKEQLVRTASLELLRVPPDKLFQLTNHKREELRFWTAEEVQGLEWRRRQYRSQQRLFRRLRRHGPTSISGVRKRKMNKQTIQSRTISPRNINRTDPGGGGDSHMSLSDISLPQDKGDLPQPAWPSTEKTPGRLSSSSLAHQLTMIDQQLFLQVSTQELCRARQDRAGARSLHWRALVSFSHRISCLVATRILSSPTVKERAVSIVQFVGVAYHCHKLHSQQSTESVLRGLQCPAVYRLQRSWAYVRKHHASKYRRFEDLSLRYADPRLPLYQKTWDNLSRTPPFLPSARLLAALLLRRLPLPPTVKSSQFTSECSDSCVAASQISPHSLSSSLRKLLSAFNIYSPLHPDAQAVLPRLAACRSDTHLQSVSTETLLLNLDKFFAPVSATCPDHRELLELEYLLDNCHAAAARYAIPLSPRVRTFLLHSPYQDLGQLFCVSRQLEPTMDN